MKRSLIFVVAVGTVASLAFAACAEPPAVRPPGMKAGLLTCKVSQGWGLVLASFRNLRCNFASADHRPEHYRGEIKRYGVDIGYHAEGTLAWAVIAPGSLKRSALAGHYGGVSGGGSAGGGVEANVLFGGSMRSVTLQPLSLESENGLNLAAGVTAMNLTPGWGG